MTIDHHPDREQADTGPRLWAVTCYFNPAGWQRRLCTYHAFRRALGVPLLTIELGFNGRLDLSNDDASQLIQIPDGDVLWQKERLLNLAIGALPQSCDAVAWLDCDVLFERTDWPIRTLEALDNTPLIQLFRQVHYLGQEWLPGTSLTDAVIRTRPSIAAGVADGLPVRDCLVHPSPDQRPGTYANGMAWAARRTLLDRHGLFDASIIGGGDRAISCAAFGCFEHVFDWHALNASQRAYYLRWAEAFHADCGGRVGVIDGDIHHLWHGKATNRGLGSRHGGLARHGFDPFTDIAIDANGCWRWASDKPALHRYLRDYFGSRREDG
jgi:hypothetical protein